METSIEDYIQEAKDNPTEYEYCHYDFYLMDNRLHGDIGKIVEPQLQDYLEPMKSLIRRETSNKIVVQFMDKHPQFTAFVKDAIQEELYTTTPEIEKVAVPVPNSLMTEIIKDYIKVQEAQFASIFDKAKSSGKDQKLYSWNEWGTDDRGLPAKITCSKWATPDGNVTTSSRPEVASLSS